MLLVILRTVILFTVVVVFLRLMGKRQIGQLQPYELAIVILISELAVIPMENTSIPIMGGLIPIFVLFTAQVLLAYISLKSEKARGLICGTPSVLIENSRIVEAEMRRQRYNINDLLEQLRSKNVVNLSDVEYAILETSGELSVILKSQKRPLTPEDLNIPTAYEGLPTTLIIDGFVFRDNLQKINLSEEWLMTELSKLGVKTPRDVLFSYIDTQGNLFCQKKDRA
ncbi:MAG: DUF421 domain-containing protein [Syntrophomonadaceae bacterium]|nr:DUF421 domain-containing protein [Syntrophomonadaceae bacterium]